jgi:hypothetical protein
MTRRLGYRRTVSLVLDELEMSFGPAGAEPADGEQGSMEIQPVADLVQQVWSCSVGSLNLTDNKIGVLCILRRHVPRLELHVKWLGGSTDLRCSMVPSGIVTGTGGKLAPRGCQ